MREGGPVRPPRGRLLVAVIASAALLAVAVPDSALASDETITVEVSDDETATPAPTDLVIDVPDAGGQSGSGGSRGSGNGQGDQNGQGAPNADAPADSLPGQKLPVVVSGLAVDNRSTLNPADGAIAASVTVKNLSTETIEGTSEFWVSNVFGMRLATVKKPFTVAPDETQDVTAVLDGFPQSGLLHVAATVTPPSVVSGMEQPPITRDAWTLVIPWIVVAGITALTAIASFVLRRRRVG
ncbi:MAG: hypothetical protein ACTHNQ_07840 [Microbacterium sp.]|uniref:hypothetical protein n=1 Tax=Microbacterium sp. TaxID=51671 RepID=UPI003F810F14